MTKNLIPRQERALRLVQRARVYLSDPPWSGGLSETREILRQAEAELSDISPEELIEIPTDNSVGGKSQRKESEA